MVGQERADKPHAVEPLPEKEPLSFGYLTGIFMACLKAPGTAGIVGAEPSCLTVKQLEEGVPEAWDFMLVRGAQWQYQRQ